MFDRFHSRLRVVGRLRARAALRIGGGKETDPTQPDLPVVRDGAQRPYIPGSSIKGVIRSYVESVVRGMEEDLACDPTQRDRWCIPSSSTHGRVGVRELKEQHRDPLKLASAIESHSCLVCRVFGSPWLASHVVFDDLPVEGWFGQFQVRNGVSIGRDSGRAERGLLYDFEVVPAGTRFALNVTLDNGEPWMRGLLELGLKSLIDGRITVGGARSRGLGSVTVDDVAYYTVDSPSELLDLLDSSDPAEQGRVVGADARRGWITALKTRLSEEAARVQASRK